MTFTQTVAINNNAYSIRWTSQYLYNHPNMGSDAGNPLPYLRVGYDPNADATGTTSNGPFLIIACFTNSPNWKGKFIKKIKFTFTVNNDAQFLNQLKFYKCNYLNGVGDYRPSASYFTGQKYRGEPINGDFGTDTKNIKTFTLSETENPTVFSSMVSYLTSADNVQNLIIYDELSDPNDSNYKETAITGITMEIIYGNTVKYYDGTTWKDCEVYYHDGSGWKPCEVQYHDGSGWKPIG